MAVNSFFEGGGANEEENEVEFVPEATRRTTQQQADAESDNDDDDDDYSPFNRNNNPFAGLSRPQQNKPKTRSSDRPRIATLRDQASDEEDEGRERGQAFYAGGSEQSGQQILGPNRQKPDEFIKGLFQKAKEYY